MTSFILLWEKQNYRRKKRSVVTWGWEVGRGIVHKQVALFGENVRSDGIAVVGTRLCLCQTQ